MSDNYMWDFFVSYVSSDRRWGEWVTQVLQAAHYEVTSLDCGQGGERAFAHALRHSRRLLPVLSPASINGTYEELVWQNECATSLAGYAREVVPIMVAPCNPSVWLGLVTPIDLTDVTVGQAADFLLTKIRAAVADGRTRPHEPPPFPG